MRDRLHLPRLYERIGALLSIVATIALIVGVDLQFRQRLVSTLGSMDWTSSSTGAETIRTIRLAIASTLGFVDLRPGPELAFVVAGIILMVLMLRS